MFNQYVLARHIRVVTDRYSVSLRLHGTTKWSPEAKFDVLVPTYSQLTGKLAGIPFWGYPAVSVGNIVCIVNNMYRQHYADDDIVQTDNCK